MIEHAFSPPNSYRLPFNRHLSETTWIEPITRADLEPIARYYGVTRIPCGQHHMYVSPTGQEFVDKIHPTVLTRELTDIHRETQNIVDSFTTPEERQQLMEEAYAAPSFMSKVKGSPVYERVKDNLLYSASRYTDNGCLQYVAEGGQSNVFRYQSVHMDVAVKVPSAAVLLGIRSLGIRIQNPYHTLLFQKLLLDNYLQGQSTHTILNHRINVPLLATPYVSIEPWIDETQRVDENFHEEIEVFNQRMIDAITYYRNNGMSAAPPSVSSAVANLFSSNIGVDSTYVNKGTSYWKTDNFKITKDNLYCIDPVLIRLPYPFNTVFHWKDEEGNNHGDINRNDARSGSMTEQIKHFFTPLTKQIENLV